MRRSDDVPATSQEESSRRAQDFIAFFDQKVSAIRDGTANEAAPTFRIGNFQQPLDKLNSTTPD
jgi:hypothetical protein